METGGDATGLYSHKVTTNALKGRWGGGECVCMCERFCACVSVCVCKNVCVMCMYVSCFDVCASVLYVLCACTCMCVVWCICDYV